MQVCKPHSHLHTVTCTRSCIDTIDSPDDDHLVARNMYRIGINKYKKKDFASSWLYFKHGVCSPFFPLRNAVCFIILTYLVHVLFKFYIQGVLKLKKNNSGAKRLMVV